jgi:general secretion pathway protein L
MSKRILGLDIHHDLVSAVVVEQKGGEVKILAGGLQVLDETNPLTAGLPLLLEEVSWQGGSCIAGISLSKVSLRNFSIPFKEWRKIQKVLHFELEEKLAVPLEEQEISAFVTGYDETGSQIVAGAVEKAYLDNITEVMEGCGLKIRRISPSLEVLASLCIDAKKFSGNCLLFHAEMQAVSVAFWADNHLIFIRRFPRPVQFSSAPPIIQEIKKKQNIQEDNNLPCNFDYQSALSCLDELCARVQFSLGSIRKDTESDIQIDQVILSGFLHNDLKWSKKVSAIFVAPTVSLNAVKDFFLTGSGDMELWHPEFHNQAIALALSGLQKKRSTSGLDFRKKTTADGLGRVSGKTIGVGAGLICLFTVFVLGYLWVDYRQLTVENNRLKGEMETILKYTFPEITKIVKPLVQMEGKLREAQAPEISIPLFNDEKRILNILADISAKVPGTVKINVSRLVIDQDSVQIRGTTDAFNNVNIIKNNLSSSDIYSEVKIVSAATDKKKGGIRFELKLQLAGAD